MDGYRSGDNQPHIPKKTQRQKKRERKYRYKNEKLIQTKLRVNEGTWNMCESSGKEDNNEVWGDSLDIKEDNVIRILTKNIGGLGLGINNDKEEHLKSWIASKQCDIIGIQETNLNWSKCRGRERLTERMKTPAWEFSRISSSHNKHDKEGGKYSYGGTLTLIKDQLTHQVKTTGADETGMGRWSWIQLVGKEGISTRIISAYQMRKVDDPRKSGSVYNQQRRVLLSKRDDTCPLRKFQDDLVHIIQKWLEKRERIVLLIDCNEDIRNGTLSEKLESIGLRSAPRFKHGEKDMPPTQHRGSTPIDDIFVSEDINIVKTGYLPFGDGPGDHRGIFIDVTRESLVGSPIHKIMRSQGRRLISTKDKVVRKFNNLFTAQLERNHVCERMEILNKTCRGVMTKDQIIEYEKLDRLYTQAFQFANKRCNKVKTGEVAYAPQEIQCEGRKIHLWTLCIRRKKGCHVSNTLIKRLAKAVDIEDPMKVTLEEMEGKRKEAWKVYRAVKPNSREIRDRWLEKKANQLALEEGEDAARYLWRLRKKEETADAHKRIKKARNKTASEGTKKLVIPNEDGGGKIEVFDKEEIEQILMKTNKEKFQQACETPFVNTYLHEVVGDMAINEESERILCGKFITSSTDEDGVADFIDNVKRAKSVERSNRINTEISLEEHQNFWKQARESTQSSMSGLHFGFYKSITKDSQLANLSRHFINIQFRNGYSSWRSRGDLNVSLQKIAGNFDPKKQRTIHLLEADFSEGCKIIFSKRMMEKARVHNQIPEEQYARKGGKAIDAALHKVLILDQFRMMRRGGICMSGDLMNCYDRMVHSVGSLSMQSLGIPPHAIKCLSSTVQRMRHFVRTAYGDSDQFYGGNDNELLQGGGQGNPAAPPMWTAISIVILKILATYEPGVMMVASISLIVTIVTAIMYVDDTDIFVMKKERESLDSLILRMQKILDTWTNALWVTGGVLRPEKCWWMLIDFKWKGSEWRYITKEDEEVNIWVPDHRKIRTKVQQIDSHESKTTLGVVIAGDGSMEGQKQKLLKTSMEWANKMEKAYLYKSEANLAINTTLARTWAYPVQATSLTLEDCVDIMKPAYKVILSKLGSNRHIPLQYRYGPKELNGLGLPHLYTMQGIAKLKALITHMKSGSKIGRTLEGQLEATNIELGTSEHLFDLEYREWELLMTKSWLKSLWEFTDRYNITVRGNYTTPRPTREYDRFLMEVVMTEKRRLFDDNEIKIINRCRVYLQVMTLGDIATTDGYQIAHRVREGIVDSNRRSSYKWPYQTRPTRGEWKIWKKAIQYAWQPLLVDEDNEPKLGRWYDNSHQEFTFRWSLEHRLVIGKEGSDWYTYDEDSTNNTRKSRKDNKFSKNKRVEVNLRLTLPISIKEINDDRIIIDGVAATNIKRIPDPIHGLNDSATNWWDKKFNEFDVQEKNMFINTRVLCGYEGLSDLINRSRLVLVSDGSYDPDSQVGTTAFRMEELDSRRIVVQGVCQTPGPKEDVNAYRSELFGMMMLLRIIEIVNDEENGCMGGIVLACDNEGGLKKCFCTRGRSSITSNHFDIVWEIFRIINKIPTHIKVFHVRGHVSYKEREGNQLALMNEDMDILAKSFLKHCIELQSMELQLDFKSQFWAVWIGGKKIIRHFDKKIIHHIHGADLIRFKKEKGRLTDETIAMIDWVALGNSTKFKTHSDILWSMKIDSRFLPVGRWMKRCEEWKDESCPMCGKVDETVQHLFHCPSKEAESIRHGKIELFIQWLLRSKTQEDIKFCFIEWMIHGGKKTFHESLPTQASSELKRIASRQDKIGWMNFICGKVDKGWGTYNCSFDKKRSGYQHARLWNCQLARQLMNFGKSIWIARSERLHEMVVSKRTQKVLHDCEEQVLHQMNLGTDGLRAKDRGLIEGIDKDTILSRSIYGQQQWVRHIQLARDRYGEEHNDEFDHMRNKLQQWLKKT